MQRDATRGKKKKGQGKGRECVKREDELSASFLTSFSSWVYKDTHSKREEREIERELVHVCVVVNQAWSKFHPHPHLHVVLPFISCDAVVGHADGGLGRQCHLLTLHLPRPTLISPRLPSCGGSPFVHPFHLFCVHTHRNNASPEKRAREAPQKRRRPQPATPTAKVCPSFLAGLPRRCAGHTHRKRGPKKR